MLTNMEFEERNGARLKRYKEEDDCEKNDNCNNILTSNISEVMCPHPKRRKVAWYSLKWD